MAKKNIHTIYNSDRKMWENKEEGSSNPLSSHHTKDNALNKGKTLAQVNEAEHFIHGKNGQFQERNSYGNASFLPEG